METTNNSAGGYRAAPKSSALNVIDWIALILMIVGGINWGLVGAFNIDLVAALFGEMSGLARAVYVLVGLAALYGIVLTIRLGRNDR